MAGQFVWINGMPGVGKLTVARALHALLPGSHLVDNHSLIDQVTLPRSHPSYNAERARVRDAVYSSLVHPSSSSESACGDQATQLARVVIFTGIASLPYATPYQSPPTLPPGKGKEEEEKILTVWVDFFTAGTIGAEWSQAHHSAAAKAGRLFLPIYLTCEREENLRRVVRPERRGDEGRSSKLTDVEMVRKFMDDSRIYRFDGVGVDIDTTTREPEETARLIREAMEAQLREMQA